MARLGASGCVFLRHPRRLGTHLGLARGQPEISPSPTSECPDTWAARTGCL